MKKLLARIQKWFNNLPQRGYHKPPDKPWYPKRPTPRPRKNK